MSDPFLQHLEKHGLTQIHREAQTVGYRVRTANGWTFDLEYQGGLARYYESGRAVKTFEQNEEGKAAARAYLKTVQQEEERRA